MSGHSKWSQIKRQKGVADVKRGALFSKLAKAISLAVKEGGGSTNPNLNARLRFAVDKAKASNMPNDNIQRAIASASKAGQGISLEELRLEGYGPGGIAIMLLAVTDNRNRTIPEIRRIFAEHGGALGEQGSAAYVFNPDPEKPIFLISVREEHLARQIINLLERLDDHEDVNEVWANYEVPDVLMESLTRA